MCLESGKMGILASLSVLCIICARVYYFNFNMDRSVIALQPTTFLLKSATLTIQPHSFRGHNCMETRTSRATYRIYWLHLTTIRRQCTSYSRVPTKQCVKDELDWHCPPCVRITKLPRICGLEEPPVSVNLCVVGGCRS